MALWDFTFWLHTSNKLKKLQLKASMNGKIVREVWRKARQRKGYPRYVTVRTSRSGMSFWLQGVSFSPFDNLRVLQSVLHWFYIQFWLLKAVIFFPFFWGTCWQDAAKLKCDTHLAPFPPFFFSKVASVLVKTCSLRGFIQETKERAAEFGGSVCEKIGDWNKNTWLLYVVFLYTSWITCLANPLWIYWIF